MELICACEFFKKLTSVNLKFQIEREKPYDYLLIIQTWKNLRGGSAGRPFLKPFSLIPENFFQSFRTKFSSSFYVISLASKISYCLSANHNPVLRCVICTSFTLFALVLHLNCTAVNQSESSNVFMYISNAQIGLLIANHVREFCYSFDNTNQQWFR